jgi:hypothetical protein
MKTDLQGDPEQEDSARYYEISRREEGIGKKLKRKKLY